MGLHTNFKCSLSVECSYDFAETPNDIVESVDLIVVKYDAPHFFLLLFFLCLGLGTILGDGRERFSLSIELSADQTCTIESSKSEEIGAQGLPQKLVMASILLLSEPQTRMPSWNMPLETVDK